MIVIDHTGIYKISMTCLIPQTLHHRGLRAAFATALLLAASTVGATAPVEPPPETFINKAAETPAPVIAPALFHAVYKADYKGLPVRAEGARELTQLEDGSYVLTSKATSFLASVMEQSTFRLGANNRLVPLEYRYQRKGIGKNRSAVLTFDWDSHQVLNNVQSVPWSMELPDGALDKLLYQLQIRMDLQRAHAAGDPWPELSYELADGGKLKTYNFEVVGEEFIDTPVGRLNTVKVNRVRENSDRETSIWLAPDYDFLLVRLVQTEGDKGGLELLLKEARFADKDVGNN